MANLVSPGVQLNVINESFYTSTAPGTVPMIFVATAENKQNASGTGVAQGTLAANNGKVYVINSQRDLADVFGTPLFYTDASKNPINAGEQNEYGLQAAYSLLGITSQVYVARADVDLAALTPSTSIPSGPAAAGTVWVDTKNSLWGIEQWNNATQTFTAITPLVIDDSNFATLAPSGTPLDSVGTVGSYAIVISSSNGSPYPNQVFYKRNIPSNAWVLVQNGFDNGKLVTVGPHYQYPTYSGATPSGSVWIKTTTPGYGANWVVKVYNGVTSTWTPVSAAIYNSDLQAIQKLDSTGGSKIPVGTIYVESDPEHFGINSATPTAAFKLFRRAATGPTTIAAISTATLASSSSITIRETNSTGTWNTPVIIPLIANTATTVGQQIALGINTSTLVNVSASYDPVLHQLTIQHSLGGDIEVNDGTGQPFHNLAGFVIGTTPNLYAGPASDGYTYLASNWKPLVYEALPYAPFTLPADGTKWYDARLGDVDIMYNNGTAWVGYRTQFPFTDPMGPTVSATMPMTQQDGMTPLANGDIWVDTSDIDMYGQNVYVFNGNTQQFVLQDVTDHVSPTGWVFADARWSTNGADNPEVVATIKNLLVSNYVDPDCVDPALYPKGTRLWNLRRSGFVVKEYMAGYINTMANNGQNLRYQNDNMANYSPDRWVSASPNTLKGVGTFGRLAQRATVVKALKAFVDTNQTIRDTDTVNFNLIACPGYTELLANLIGLNTDRGQTALVVGDTPFRLTDNPQDLTAWAKNTAGAVDNGEGGLVTHDNYTAIYYPGGGYTSDNTGNAIVVPSSHMLLHTIISSDNVSYPWFAPAGTNRGNITNATAVGYVDPMTAEFKSVSVYQSLRDLLAPLAINPIATIPGVGLVAFGQYTLTGVSSALDRINVARLVAYLRQKLTLAVKPFLFEPNDAQTRNEVKLAVETILQSLVGARALNDFVVVCDTVNNTPTRIDQSQLWVDIAIEPIKATEFIYIPLRLLNTGAIASGNLGKGFPGSTAGQ